MFFLNFVVKIGGTQAHRNNPCYENLMGLGTHTFDLQTMFANLTEKERLKGHHSAEGRAIRTLSRAMNGWSSGNFAALDMLVSRSDV